MIFLPDGVRASKRIGNRGYEEYQYSQKSKNQNTSLNVIVRSFLYMLPACHTHVLQPNPLSFIDWLCLVMKKYIFET